MAYSSNGIVGRTNPSRRNQFIFTGSDLGVHGPLGSPQSQRQQAAWSLLRIGSEPPRPQDAFAALLASLCGMLGYHHGACVHAWLSICMRQTSGEAVKLP